MLVPRTSHRLPAVATAAMLGALVPLAAGGVAAFEMPRPAPSALLAWTKQSPATAPPGRSHAAVAFDPATRTTVVFGGGATVSETRGDTWTWDGTGWAQQRPPDAPPARTDASLTYDPGTETAVLFGGGGMPGSGAFSDTWLWNGSDWSTSLPLSLLPTLAPPPRGGAAAAAGPNGRIVAGRIVAFGGASEGHVMNDTWTLGSGSPGPTPSSLDGGASGGPTTAVPGPRTPTTATSGSRETTARGRRPTTRGAPSPARLAAGARSMREGDALELSGGGFQPSSTVTIVFRSIPKVVGHVVTDAQGRFGTTVVVPSDARPGGHRKAVGTGRDGGQLQLVAQISILAPPTGTRGCCPPSWWSSPVMVAIGAAVVLAPSARWNHRAVVSDQLA